MINLLSIESFFYGCMPFIARFICVLCTHRCIFSLFFICMSLWFHSKHFGLICNESAVSICNVCFVRHRSCRMNIIFIKDSTRIKECTRRYNCWDLDCNTMHTIHKWCRWICELAAYIHNSLRASHMILCGWLNISRSTRELSGVERSSPPNAPRMQKMNKLTIWKTCELISAQKRDVSFAVAEMLCSVWRSFGSHSLPSQLFYRFVFIVALEAFLPYWECLFCLFLFSTFVFFSLFYSRSLLSSIELITKSRWVVRLSLLTIISQ